MEEMRELETIKNKLLYLRNSKISKHDFEQSNFLVDGTLSFNKDPMLGNESLAEAFSYKGSERNYRNVGENWTEVLSPNNMVLINWLKIVNKGQNQLALHENYAVISRDFGKNWKRLTPRGPFTSCDMTTDSQIIILSRGNGETIYSQSYGETWTTGDFSNGDYSDSKLMISEYHSKFYLQLRGLNSLFVSTNGLNFTELEISTDEGSHFVFLRDFIGHLTDFYVDGDYIYIADDTSGLYKINILSRFLYTIRQEGYNNIYVKGNFLISKNEDGVSISSDSGENWTDTSLGDYCECITATNNFSVIFVSTLHAKVFKSVDRGMTFTELQEVMSYPRMDDIFYILDIDNSGENLTILTPFDVMVSNNGGDNFTENINIYTNYDSFTNTFFDCYFGNRTPIVALAGDYGVMSRHLTLYTTKDMGKTWKQILNLGILEATLSASVSVSGKYMVVLGQNNYYYSSDFGTNWKKKISPYKGFSTYCHLNEEKIVFIGYNIVAKSDNFGKDWRLVYTLSLDNFYPIHLACCSNNQSEIIFSTYDTIRSKELIYYSSDSGELFIQKTELDLGLTCIKYSGSNFYYSSISHLYKIIDDSSYSTPLEIDGQISCINNFDVLDEFILLNSNPNGDDTGKLYISSNNGFNFTDCLNSEDESSMVGDFRTTIFCQNLKSLVLDRYNGVIYISEDGYNYSSNLLINTGIYKYNLFGKISMSKSGQFQVCTSLFGGIVTSNNYGKTWRRFFQSFTLFCYYSAISGTGKHIMVIGIDIENYTTGIFISHDYGKTFDPVNLPIILWIACSCSFTGKYMATMALNGSVFISRNYGESWSSYDLLSIYEHRISFRGREDFMFSDSFTLIAKQVFMSESGQIIKVMTIGGIIIGSEDYGETWKVKQDFGVFCFFGAMSGDGKHFSIAACSYDGFLGYSNIDNVNDLTFVNQIDGWNILTSEDFCKTFSIANGINGRQNIVYNVGMSEDGKHQIALGYGCVYSSYDYGKSFKLSNAENPFFTDFFLYLTSACNGAIFKTMSVSGTIYENKNFEGSDFLLNYKIKAFDETILISEDASTGADFYEYCATSDKEIEILLPEIQKMNPPIRKLIISFSTHGYSSSLTIKCHETDDLTALAKLKELTLSNTCILTLFSNGVDCWYTDYKDVPV